MWCKCCREDVPGIASAGEGRFCCARCGSPMGAESHGGTAETWAAAQAAFLDAPAQKSPGGDGHPAPTNDPLSPSNRPPFELDEWDFEVDWKQLRSLAAATAVEPTRPD